MPVPPPPTAALRPLRRASLAACCALVAALLAGCGSSSHSGGTEADPATAVPATAPLYIGLTAKPTGSQRTAAVAAAAELTGKNEPFAGLAGLLQTPGSPALDWAHDVSPWLGPHAGLFLASLAGTESLVEPLTKALAAGALQPLPLSKLDGAIVMDTTDTGAARSFIAGQAKRAGAHATRYRGVSYEVGSGVAFGLVGRFAVIGSEAALRAVIGVTQGESALSRTANYQKLTTAAPGEAIGHLFVNPPSGGSAAPAAAGARLLALLGGGRPANLSIVPAAGSLTLDVDTIGQAGAPAGGLLAPDPEAAKALGELPGTSWLALGLGHAGQNLPADVAGLNVVGGLVTSEGSGPISLGSLLGGLSKPLSILGAPTASARRDYTSWMGSAGVFAAGSSVLELKAGVVISSTDPARSRAAVAKLGAALRAKGNEVSHASIAGTEAALATRLPGVPLELDVAAGQSPSGPKFVLGLGEASVQAALAGGETMSSATSRTAAATALGEGIQPSVVADVPTLFALLESVGLTEDPSLKAILPYLRATTALSGGGRSLGGEVARFKLVLSLKQAAG